MTPVAAARHVRRTDDGGEHLRSERWRSLSGKLRSRSCWVGKANTAGLSLKKQAGGVYALW